MKFSFKKNLINLVWFLPVVLFFIFLPLVNRDFTNPDGVKLGFTFSSSYAEELGLDWREVYSALLEDMQVKHLRLPAYWNRVEKIEGKYDFSELDEQINLAEKNNVKLILAVGRRLPRWPECHDPVWLAGLEKSEFESSLLNYVKSVVERYKNSPAIAYWQVENEPFLSVFGECPPLDKELLTQEVSLVRKLDPSRPVIITESGELSSWFRGGQLADIIGVSIYKMTWNDFWGYFYYPLPPAFYYYKTKLVQRFTRAFDVFSTELQVEPWTSQPITSVPLTEQFSSMDLDQIQTNVSFAKKTGFREIYLWGAEWWYWLKQKHNRPEFWNYGKKLFSQDF